MVQAEIGATRSPAPIDVHVGNQVRLRRKQLGITQEALGEAIGVTFQQVQKYERGVNRIGASRLQQIAAALDVPISHFFPKSDAATDAAGRDKDLALRAAAELTDALAQVLRRAQGEVRSDTQPVISAVLRAARTIAEIDGKPSSEALIESAERSLGKDRREPA
ncbi:helix-turn-helix domain-containing protein [Propylenella binzhouense]|uniref:Helix-turn-helix domain-containing protein n=1 Tax=Propylenella binzhouense TaxID=2555902 RepID=A0A964T9N8_9HYPH|nr:helix-turn-helix domain-containing protein [Propylenella binzhouense]MYZ49887.1 helix-turn-helix domain-containing protein [Propylenella binzhouense]